jgi:hypothetical protein
MLTAAAVCPHPPLLVPQGTGGATGPGDTELAALRDACEAAVSTLIAARPGLLIVVGGAEHTRRYPPDAAGALADYGVPFAIGDTPPVLPLSLTVGRWLTSGHDAVLQAVAADATPGQCLLLGAELAGLAPSVAILAMGDGPARRARRAPGAVDADADRYEQQVADALAAADARLLAALDPRHDDELFVAGRAAWQVLAGSALAGAGPRFTAHLRYAKAPFEVSYFVATWVR